jgi:hypothetical protein
LSLNLVHSFINTVAYNFEAQTTTGFNHGHGEYRDEYIFRLPGDGGKRNASMLTHKEKLIPTISTGFSEGLGFLAIAVSRWAKRRCISVSSSLWLKNISNDTSP